MSAELIAPAKRTPAWDDYARTLGKASDEEIVAFLRADAVYAEDRNHALICEALIRVLGKFMK